MAQKPVIELDDIRRDFIVGEETVHALRGVSFTIHEGEFVTIMGTSGSGKSTLLNILGCLDTPTSGEYCLDGTPVRTMSKTQRAVLRNRKIGFVFQSYNLLAKTTAVENVELPLMYNSTIGATPAAALVGIVFGMSLHLFVAEEKGVRQICSTDTIRIVQPVHDTLYLTQIVERERVIEKPVTQVAEADAGEADLQPEECTSIQCDGINYAILASN